MKVEPLQGGDGSKIELCIDPKTNDENKDGSSSDICKASSLQDLISKLYKEFDKDVVNVDYINELMSSYKSVSHEWKKYAKFDRYR